VRLGRRFPWVAVFLAAGGLLVLAVVGVGVMSAVFLAAWVLLTLAARGVAVLFLRPGRHFPWAALLLVAGALLALVALGAGLMLEARRQARQQALAAAFAQAAAQQAAAAQWAAAAQEAAAARAEALAAVVAAEALRRAEVPPALDDKAALAELQKLAESVRLCEAEADAARGRLKADWAQIDQPSKTHREPKLDLENNVKDLGARQEEMKEREERQRAEMCRLKTDARCCAEEMTRRVEKFRNAKAQARAKGQAILDRHHGWAANPPAAAVEPLRQLGLLS
jgi:hypothetical protein